MGHFERRGGRSRLEEVHCTFYVECIIFVMFFFYKSQLEGEEVVESEKKNSIAEEKSLDDLDDLIRQEREKEKQNKVAAPLEAVCNLCMYVCMYVCIIT